MATYRDLFVRHLNIEGIKFVEYEDQNHIKITYEGDNLNTIPIHIFFDEDGDPYVQFKCWDIQNFKGKEAKGILACNMINKQYRWVKFYLDDDADIVASIDGYIDIASCGEECLSLVRRVVSITDDAYPTFAKAKWAD